MGVNRLTKGTALVGSLKADQNITADNDLSVGGDLTVTGATTFTGGAQSSAVAVTATAAGTGTGVIPAGASYVTVTSANADHIVTLPAPVVGNVLWINVGANGFELRSSAPATISINGGAEADAESAIAANSTVLAICISATAWKAIFLDADSDVAKVTAAAAA